MSTWVYDDGGRATVCRFVRTDPGDCVTRAIAIASCVPYAEVYRRLADLSKLMGGRRSARDGMAKPVYERYLLEHGWTWTPTMRIGSGTTIHLRADELPAGRIIARCSRHLVAVIDGVVHDTCDPSRDGSRAVYGYWTAP